MSAALDLGSVRFTYDSVRRIVGVRGPRAACEAVRAEIERRSALFAAKIPPRPRRVPMIVIVHPAPTARWGACVSCGDPLPAHRSGHCALCEVALVKALQATGRLSR